MRWAHHLGKQVLPAYASKFSRRDFTLPQLFACLALREHQKKSYRGVEALLRDSPEWCAAIDMAGVPDHNTLCRAFGVIVRLGHMNHMLDLQACWAKRCHLIQGRRKPVALDSSLFESRHVSRHFERRCRETRRRGGGGGGGGDDDDNNKHRRRQNGRKDARKQQGNQRRSRTVKSLPKLSLAVASKSHLILAARARHRWRAGLRTLRAAVIRCLASRRCDGGGCRQRVRQRVQSPDRASGHGRAVDHARRHRPPRQGRETAQRILAATHAPPAPHQARPATQRLYAALAGRDGQQHAQAKPGPGAARPHRAATLDGTDAPLRDPQPDDLQSRAGVRVETEQDAASFPATCDPV